MTKITQEEVLKIASISNIRVTEQEIEQLKHELEAVLSYAERVTMVTGDAPDSGIMPVNVFRDDTACASENTVFLQGSPDATEGYFVVPLIIEQNS